MLEPLVGATGVGDRVGRVGLVDHGAVGVDHAVGPVELEESLLAEGERQQAAERGDVARQGAAGLPLLGPRPERLDPVLTEVREAIERERKARQVVVEQRAEGAGLVGRSRLRWNGRRIQRHASPQRAGSNGDTGPNGRGARSWERDLGSVVVAIR